MNEEIERAVREAAEAAADARQLEVIKAVLAAQQVQQPACQHPAPRPEFDARKWLVIGGTVSVCSFAAALFAVAVAVGAVSVAILALVLRALWRDVQRGR
ncbi:hypothetical protein [Streptomyces soliscabiei]|uniref:hypothetical protein n=1 Tax=Streptomyces soliscabiei TaxID=588897 RepID=UPI0029B5466C|nr:hypothetical protein [Streptomyces sp. NY05-11A]MDX2675812.1 hypothetical protein [Streptomyces sp. NY05-11A]